MFNEEAKNVFCLIELVDYFNVEDCPFFEFGLALYSSMAIDFGSNLCQINFVLLLYPSVVEMLVRYC